MFSVKEGKDNIFILWGENINIFFIVCYKPDILKNRNTFIDVCLSIVSHGKIQDAGGQKIT